MDEKQPVTEGAPDAQDIPEEDVEGQMIGRAIAISGVMSTQKRERTPSDDDLKPLTKPFPSMRSDTAKK